MTGSTPRRSLRRALDGRIGRRLEPDEALALGEAVLRALAELHASGQPHGAISAEAILIGSSLADAGLLPADDAPPLAEPATPDHLDARAPEVVRGGPRTVTADIWAFGHVIHEAVCGAPPTLERLAPGVLLGGRGTNVPVALDRLVAGSLVEAPGDRWADAGVALAELRRALTEKPGDESARELGRSPTEPTAEELARPVPPPVSAVVMSGDGRMAGIPPAFADGGVLGGGAPERSAPASSPGSGPAPDAAPGAAATATVLAVLGATTLASAVWLVTSLLDPGVGPARLIAPSATTAVGLVLIVFWILGQRARLSDPRGSGPPEDGTARR